MNRFKVALRTVAHLAATRRDHQAQPSEDPLGLGAVKAAVRSLHPPRADDAPPAARPRANLPLPVELRQQIIDLVDTPHLLAMEAVSRGMALDLQASGPRERIEAYKNSVEFTIIKSYGRLPATPRIEALVAYYGRKSDADLIRKLRAYLSGDSWRTQMSRMTKLAATGMHGTPLLRLNIAAREFVRRGLAPGELNLRDPDPAGPSV